MNALRKYAPAALGTGLLSLVGSAHADLPTGVTAAITTATTDGVTLVGALALFGATVFLIYKLLKRFGIIG